MENQQRIKKNKRVQKLDARRGKGSKRSRGEHCYEIFPKDKKFPKACSDPLVRLGPVSSSAWIDQKRRSNSNWTCCKEGPKEGQKKRVTVTEPTRWDQRPGSGLAGDRQGNRGPRLHTCGGSSRLLVSLSFVSEASTRHFPPPFSIGRHSSRHTQSAQQRGGRMPTTNSKHKRTMGFRRARLVQFIKEKSHGQQTFANSAAVQV